MLVALLWLVGLPWVDSLDAAGWKQRSIYQVITDRFALASGDRDTCNEGGCPYGNYCGGTYKGLQQQLPYITGMGFDAIWISPVVDNTNCGYHGYWAQKQFELESHFGGAQQLTDFMQAARGAGVAVMLDIVVNHMGPPSQGSSFFEFDPFNSTDHYHGTLSSHCSATDTGVSQQQRETCWLANLGDLKQENPYVTDQLLQWAYGLQKTYNFDGIRIDTVPYVPKMFFQKLKSGPLQGTYAVGECLVPISMEAVAGYQWSNDEGVYGPLLDGVLNYPLYDALRECFQNGGPLRDLLSTWQQINSTFHDVGALGNFAENHDQPRWLLGNADVSTYQNALTFTFMSPGVPIAYYGTEQGMAGQEDDNGKRQPLWQHGGYNQQAPLYQWTARLVAARKTMLKSLSDQSIDSVSYMNVTPDGSVLSFVRGAALVAVSQRSFDGQEVLQTPWPTGTLLCDALAETASDVLGSSNCSVAQRQECGHLGTSKEDCESQGCCWSPLTPNPGNLPWCFHSSAGPPPPPSPPSPPAPPSCVQVGQAGSVQVNIKSGLPSVFIAKNLKII